MHVTQRTVSTAFVPKSEHAVEPPVIMYFLLNICYNYYAFYYSNVSFSFSSFPSRFRHLSITTH